VEVFSAQVLVLPFKNSCVNSGRNYSHTAASFGDWASPGDSGKPMAVSYQTRSAFVIGAQLSRLLVRCKKSVRRPSQDRAWRAGITVKIATAIKEAAASHMPHVMDADDDAHSARQFVQPSRNIKPVRNGMQMYNINVCQFFRARR
jgi:hypothetical protein